MKKRDGHPFLSSGMAGQPHSQGCLLENGLILVQVGVGELDVGNGAKGIGRKTAQ